MNCCNEKPVIELTAGERLCKNHFTKYFESKVFKTIRQFDLIGKKENLGVALSGGKDSLTVLHILNKLSKQNPKIKLKAIAIDEGIHGYREKTLIKAKKFCEENKIILHIFSYKGEFGLTLDEMLKILDVKPCTICGIFRRYLLNKKSKELKLTKVGLVQDKKFVQRIKPLYLCTEKEVTTYAFTNGLLDEFNECQNVSQSYRAKVRDMLNEFEQKFPGTKYSIVNSFLQILPLLKQKFKDGSIKVCAKCNEPSANDVCNACLYLEKLKSKLVC